MGVLPEATVCCPGDPGLNPLKAPPRPWTGVWQFEPCLLSPGRSTHKYKLFSCLKSWCHQFGFHARQAVSSIQKHSIKGTLAPGWLPMQIGVAQPQPEPASQPWTCGLPLPLFGT